jgi:hypothetical protein
MGMQNNKSGLTLDDVVKKNIELPFIINGVMWGYFTTDWDREKYIEILKKFPDEEYPIVCDLETNMPLLDETTGEPTRNMLDQYIFNYNFKQKSLRMVHMIRLFGRGIDFPLNDTEAVDLLNSLGEDVYLEVEKTLNLIVQHKMLTLQELQRKNLRNLLASNSRDNTKNEFSEKVIKEKIKDITKEIDVLRKRLGNKNIRIIEEEIEDKEKELEDLHFKLTGESKDGISYRYGFKYYGVLMKMMKEYHLPVDYMLKVISNELNEEEQILYNMMWVDISLNIQAENERVKEQQKEYEKMKRKSK